MRGRGDLVASGAWLVGFVGLAVLFEIVVGLGGDRNLAASRYVLAVLLIVAGLGAAGPSAAGGQTAMTRWESARPPRDLLAARGGRRERALAELEGGHRG